MKKDISWKAHPGWEMKFSHKDIWMMNKSEVVELKRRFALRLTFIIKEKKELMQESKRIEEKLVRVAENEKNWKGYVKELEGEVKRRSKKKTTKKK